MNSTNTYSASLWNELEDDGSLWLIPTDETVVWIDGQDTWFVYFYETKDVCGFVIERNLLEQ